MRGAAMKIGQVLSTVDFTAIPQSEREAFKQTFVWQTFASDYHLPTLSSMRYSRRRRCIMSKI